MATDFKQLLMDSIPYKETDVFSNQETETPLAKAHRSVDAIIALGVTTPAEMLNVLEDVSVDTELRTQILDFVGWMKYKPAIEPLIRIAASEVENFRIRRGAMVYLASLSQQKALSVLEPLCLNHPDPEIRLSAVAAVAVTRHKSAFKLLTKIIVQDNSPEVRGQAIRAIDSVHETDTNIVYSLLISKITDTEEDTTVRAYAVEGLGFLKDKRAVDIIIRHLSHEAPEIRYMAAYALGLVGDKSHLPLLEAMLADDAVFEGWGPVAEGAKEGIEELLRFDACASGQCEIPDR